jgi:hypothetical protein
MRTAGPGQGVPEVPTPSGRHRIMSVHTGIPCCAGDIWLNANLHARRRSDAWRVDAPESIATTYRKAQTYVLSLADAELRASLLPESDVERIVLLGGVHKRRDSTLIAVSCAPCDENPRAHRTRRAHPRMAKRSSTAPSGSQGKPLLLGSGQRSRS